MKVAHNMPLILLFKHFLECFGSTMQHLTAFLVRVEFADPSLSKIGVKKGNLRDIIETGQDSVCGVGRKQIIPGAGCSSSSSEQLDNPLSSTRGELAGASSTWNTRCWCTFNLPHPLGLVEKNQLPSYLVYRPSYQVEHTPAYSSVSFFLATRNRLEILQVSLSAG